LLFNDNFNLLSSNANFDEYYAYFVEL
jgi:hypothetical protein